MIRVLLGSFLAAVVMYVLGAVWWMALPFANRVVDRAADEAAALAAIDERFPTTGVYFVPFPDEGAADPVAEMERVDALQRSGPIAMVVVRQEGVDALSARGMALGFVHLWVVALLLGALVWRFARPGGRYAERVGLVALAAIAGVTMSKLGNPVWYHHPWAYWVVNSAFDLLLMVGGGLVLAAIVRPTRPPAA